MLKIFENNEKLEKSANMLKSIAHPTRLKILSMLKDSKEHNVTEIYLNLSCDQPTISHHLGTMKDKGVLKSRRDGKNTYYSIKKNTFIDCISKSLLSNIDEIIR